MLIITEGSQTEPKLLKQLARCFQTLNKFEIYSYKTNLYDLYTYIEDYLVDGDELDGDILQILVERERAQSQRLVLQQNYSDILLVFDFEPQDHRYDFHKLQTLLKVFNESTENGKLYINYPMVESFKHFKSINDVEYIERKVSLANIRQYKDIAARECGIGNIGDLTKDKYIMIINENLKKTMRVIGVGYVYPDIEGLDEYLFTAAEKQDRNIKDNAFCYILNTGLFFLPQFNSDWANL